MDVFAHRRLSAETHLADGEVLPGQQTGGSSRNGEKELEHQQHALETE